MAKYTIEEIHGALDDIHRDIRSEIDRLEGEAPDYMNFSNVAEANKELLRQCEILRKWIDGFSLDQVTVTHY